MPFAVDDGEAARHAEVKDQDLAALEESEDIFRPPFEADDSAALDTFDEIGREGKAQIRALEAHAADALAQEHRFKPAHHGFDFGKFRHEALLDQFDGEDKDY